MLKWNKESYNSAVIETDYIGCGNTHVKVVETFPEVCHAFINIYQDDDKVCLSKQEATDLLEYLKLIIPTMKDKGE